MSAVFRGMGVGECVLVAGVLVDEDEQATSKIGVFKEFGDLRR
jgi:hypothetical protein